MVTDPYKAVSCQFSFARVHSYFVKRANLPINYNSISDFSPIWNIGVVVVVAGITITEAVVLRTDRPTSHQICRRFS